MGRRVDRVEPVAGALVAGVAVDDTEGLAADRASDDVAPGVLIVAADTAMSRALNTALSARLHLRVIGEVGDCAGLCVTIAQSRPELVIVDWAMPGLPADREGMRCLSGSQAQVIALTSSEESDADALALGVSACFRKSANPDDLIVLTRQLLAAGKSAE